MATDHESLSGLMGKGPRHLHITPAQYEKFLAKLKGGPPPVITAGQALALMAGVSMAPYAVAAENAAKSVE